jgi:hypothetical protein
MTPCTVYREESWFHWSMHEWINLDTSHSTYKMVKRLFTQFTAHIFAVPLNGSIPFCEPSRSIFFRLSLPRDGFLIQFLTEQSSVHHPRHLVLTDSSNGGPFLVKPRDYIAHSPLFVSIWFDPVQFVKIQSTPQMPTQFRLPTFTAKCICLRDDLEDCSSTTHVEHAGPGDYGGDEAASCCIL